MTGEQLRIRDMAQLAKVLNSLINKGWLITGRIECKIGVLNSQEYAVVFNDDAEKFEVRKEPSVFS